MTDNVIDLKNRKKKEETPRKKSEEYDFEEVIKQNKANEERIKREKEKANRSVKRSYRLDKDKK